MATAPVLPMIIVGSILVLTFVAIAFEFLHKTLAALLGALAAIIAGLLLGIFHGERPYAEVHEFIGHDLGVIGVIVGTSILVEIAAASGLFHFIAIKLVKLTGGKPALLFPTVLAATVAFVTFLTIAPGVLIMTSLVLVITKALEDYAALGSSSLGTTQDILLPLNLVTGPAPVPAAWAARLSRPGSELHLLAVADSEVADTIRVALREKDRIEDIDEDRLAGLVRPDVAGLVAALQRASTTGKYTCRVVVRNGPVAAAVTEYANSGSGLIVTTCTADCTSTGFQRVQAIVRGSRNPVLVI